MTRATTSRRRHAFLVMLAVWAAVTSVLTLSPTSYTPPLTLETFVCIACGWGGTADLVLNWLLFLPGGALLTVLLGGRRAVLAAVCLTAMIETVQIAIPGRSPSLQDLLFNTVGALSGLLLVRRGLGARTQHALALGVAGAWVAPLVLLIPMTTSSDLYGLWTPAFANFETYDGRILAASVGGHPVRPGRLTDKPAIDSAIVQRRPLELSLRVGPPPPSFAPVFQVVDGRRVALVSVGALGSDLIVHGNNPAQTLRLAQPGVRWPGALSEATPGDTVGVLIDRTHSSMCMSVGHRTRCELAPSLGDGWGLLISLEGAAGWLLALASVLWSMGLGVVLGATSASVGVAALRGAALAVAGLALAVFSPDVRPDLVHAIALAVASPLGGSLRRPIGSVWLTWVRPAVTG